MTAAILITAAGFSAASLILATSALVMLRPRKRRRGH